MTEPECRYVLGNTVQKNIKSKGIDTGRGWGRGNIILQIDDSKPPHFLTQSSTKFLIIFTMSIANII